MKANQLAQIQILFQFLNGTIKSNVSSQERGTIILFQFLNGTIKSKHTKPKKPKNNLFQFLNGTIKRTYFFNRK